jgi:hypothetical protein
VNPGVQLLLLLVCLFVGVLCYFAFEVLIFRLSCRLARAPRPTIGRSIGIVMVVLIAVSAAEGLVSSILIEAYIAGGYPLWEAGLVAFFICLPVHMLVASAIHAKMMAMSFVEGFAVWFVEKAIKLGMIAFVAAMIALVLLLARVLR